MSTPTPVPPKPTVAQVVEADVKSEVSTLETGAKSIFAKYALYIGIAIGILGAVIVHFL